MLCVKIYISKVINKDIHVFQKQRIFFKTDFFINYKIESLLGMYFNVVESESSKQVSNFSVWFEETGNSSHQFARILIIQEVLTKLGLLVSLNALFKLTQPD